MDNVIIIIAKDENAAQDVKDALKKLEAGETNGREKFNDNETLLTVKDVQMFLGIGKEKAYKMFKDKRFPSFQLGNRHYVRKDKFFAYLDSKCNTSVKLLK